MNVAASSEDRKFTYAPTQSSWKLSPEAAYVHYTGNETIGGVEFHWIPDTGAVPLVCDLSSSLLSRPLDVSRFGLIYAGAQKNIGPAGLTIVIVREDLIGHARRLHAVRCSTTRSRPTTSPCTTRRRPTRCTSPAWCSSGSSATAAWREMEKINIAKAKPDLRCAGREPVLRAARWPGRTARA